MGIRKSGFVKQGIDVEGKAKNKKNLYGKKVAQA